MSKKAQSILEGKSAAEKGAIAAHAAQIYTQMQGKLPINQQNRISNKSQAETAIEFAEYFHEVLVEKGYGEYR